MKKVSKQNLIYSLESVLYNGVVRFLLWKKPKYDKKYRISIVGIFKNESRFLKEWIEYHLMIGVDHFYMYNNNSEDDFESVLKPYVEKGVVTLVEWKKNNAQMEAYQDFFERYGHETQWMVFLDLDEYIVPRYKSNLYEWIKDYERYPVILVYWKMFGTSGKIKHDFSRLVMEQYIVSHEGFSTHKGKCFVNTDFKISFYNEMTHHSSCVKYPLLGINLRMQPINQFRRFVVGSHHLSCLGERNPSIQINHYWSMSWDLFEEKRNRTDVYFKVNPKKNLNYFYSFEEQNISCDFSIFRFIMKLKHRLV